MPYVILLNQLQGVELILKGLAERCRNGCIASGDLWEGISRNAMYQDPVTGKMTKLIDMAMPLEEPDVAPEPEPQPKLRLVKS